MKILIITYNREVNPGTFLQGYGVQCFFRKLYPESTIHMFRHKRGYVFIGGDFPAKKDWNFVVGKLAAIPRRIKYERCNLRHFKFPKEEFGFFDYDEAAFRKFAERYDLIVVGSDTILINLKKEGRYGLMWLLGVHTDKILFAASAAPARFSLTGEDVALLRENFSSFRLIGVRDTITLSLFRDKIGLGEKAFRMPDPTYLIPSSAFRLPWIARRRLDAVRKDGKKVALVNFGDGFAGKKAVTEHLRREGYRTVATIYNPWADINLMTFSPFQWAALFPFLDLTVTERFHDSVFTLRNNKPLVAVDWTPGRFAPDGSSKTLDLMDAYGLGAYHCTYDEASGVSHVLQAAGQAARTFDAAKTKEVNRLIAEDCRKLMERMGKMAEGGFED